MRCDANPSPVAPPRQRRGLVPLLVIASLVLLVLLISIMRAAASARGDESGFVCFLSKLGVQIGAGCHGSSGSRSVVHATVKQALGELVEATPRIKDIEPSIPTRGSILKADGSVVRAAVASAAADGAGGGRAGLLRRRSMQLLL